MLSKEHQSFTLEWICFNYLSKNFGRVFPFTRGYKYLRLEKENIFLFIR